MSKYPELSDELATAPNGDDCAFYDAAKGDESAQLWLGRYHLLRSEIFRDDTPQAANLILAIAYSGLAAAHGKVVAIKLYRDCLSRHRELGSVPASSSSDYDALITRLSAAILDRSNDERVEVRV